MPWGEFCLFFHPQIAIYVLRSIEMMQYFDPPPYPHFHTTSLTSLPYFVRSDFPIQCLSDFVTVRFGDLLLFVTVLTIPSFLCSLIAANSVSL